MAVDVLVTGAAGALGRQTVRTLRGAGYQVMACGRAIERGIDTAWDLAQQQSPEPDLRPKIVVHAAAITGSYQQPISESEALFEVNVSGTLRLARWCESAGVKRLIMISGAIVYGRWEDSPKLETDVPEPWVAGPYAVSKWCSEQAASLIKNTQTEITILRLSSLYGSGYRYGLPQRMLFGARQAGKLILKPPLNDAFDFLHVSDAATTVHHAIESESVGLWNVGSGGLLTIHKLGQVCAEQVGVPITVTNDSINRPNRILNWVDDNNARIDLGHQNKVSIEAGIAEIAGVLKCS